MSITSVGRVSSAPAVGRCRVGRCTRRIGERELRSVVNWERDSATLTPCHPRCYRIAVKTIFAFNGDLESRLALHWLVHERGREVVALSVNIGQGVYLETLGELARNSAPVPRASSTAGRIPARFCIASSASECGL